MNASLMTMLRCPAGCAAEVRLEATTRVGDEIADGSLTCEGCGRRYVIAEGIARMLPSDLAEATGGKSDDPALQYKLNDMQARDEQVADYDRMWYLNWFGVVEIPLTIRQLDPGPEHTVLEAGCGTGRMTPEFARNCGRLIAVDFSIESLRLNAAKMKAAGIRNIDYVQADICSLPFRTNAFDRVVSGGVLGDLPSAETRDGAVRDMARVLRPDGRLVISAYKYSLLERLWGRKEGEHAGGIYFFRFTEEEYRAQLGKFLKVEAIFGALVYYFVATCRKEAV